MITISILSAKTFRCCVRRVKLCGTKFLIILSFLMLHSVLNLLVLKYCGIVNVPYFLICVCVATGSLVQASVGLRQWSAVTVPRFGAARQWGHPAVYWQEFSVLLFALIYILNPRRAPVSHLLFCDSLYSAMTSTSISLNNVITVFRWCNPGHYSVALIKNISVI